MGTIKIQGNNPALWRAASACWEAGCIDRFYRIDMAHMALIIATWESKVALEGVRIEKMEAAA